MKDSTVRAMEGVLRTDESVDAAERERLVGMARGSALGAEPPRDRIVRRAEAARLLGRTPKTVDKIAARGAITKVAFPGFKRAAGYRLSDVERLIAGGAGADAR